MVGEKERERREGYQYHSMISEFSLHVRLVFLYVIISDK